MYPMQPPTSSSNFKAYFPDEYSQFTPSFLHPPVLYAPYNIINARTHAHMHTCTHAHTHIRYGLLASVRYYPGEPPELLLLLLLLVPSVL